MVLILLNKMLILLSQANFHFIKDFSYVASTHDPICGPRVIFLSL
jgi:hypothetical protein